MQTKEFYMCSTEFNHELGECKCEAYSSLDEILSDRRCAKSCGVLKITLHPPADGLNISNGVYFVEEVVPTDFSITLK